MKTNSPTHEEIAHRAQQIWNSRGSPSGCDVEIWLEAERQLAAHASERGSSASAPSHSTHPSTVPAPSPDDIAAKAALQKQAARAPQLPHGKNTAKPAPPQSGKPLWDQPHSS